eukprot:g6564.t1
MADNNYRSPSDIVLDVGAEEFNEYFEDHGDLDHLISESRKSTQIFEQIKSYFGSWEAKLKRERDDVQSLTLKMEEERRHLNDKKNELEQLETDVEKRRVSERETNEEMMRDMQRREEEVARMEASLLSRQATMEDLEKELEIKEKRLNADSNINSAELGQERGADLELIQKLEEDKRRDLEARERAVEEREELIRLKEASIERKEEQSRREMEMEAKEFENKQQEIKARMEEVNAAAGELEAREKKLEEKIATAQLNEKKFEEDIAERTRSLATREDLFRESMKDEVNARKVFAQERAEFEDKKRSLEEQITAFERQETSKLEQMSSKLEHIKNKELAMEEKELALNAHEHEQQQAQTEYNAKLSSVQTEIQEKEDRLGKLRKDTEAVEQALFAAREQMNIERTDLNEAQFQFTRGQQELNDMKQQTTSVEATDTRVAIEMEPPLEKSPRNPAQAPSGKQKRSRTVRQSTSGERDASLEVEEDEMEANGSPKKQKSEGTKRVIFGITSGLRYSSPSESSQE